MLVPFVPSCPPLHEQAAHVGLLCWKVLILLLTQSWQTADWHQLLPLHKSTHGTCCSAHPLVRLHWVIFPFSPSVFSFCTSNLLSIKLQDEGVGRNVLTPQPIPPIHQLRSLVGLCQSIWLLLPTPSYNQEALFICISPSKLESFVSRVSHERFLTGLHAYLVVWNGKTMASR